MAFIPSSKTYFIPWKLVFWVNSIHKFWLDAPESASSETRRHDKPEVFLASLPLMKMLDKKNTEWIIGNYVQTSEVLRTVKHVHQSGMLCIPIQQIGLFNKIAHL